MIKVQNNIATRESLPAFLIGLAPESLADLSWTDPALGVANAAWWPEADQSPALAEYERYGAETLAVDADNKQVIVVRAVEPWSAEEIAADKLAKRNELISAYNTALDQHLDTTAQSKRYTDRFTCAIRAGFQGPYQAEGIAFAQWMDSCNQLAYQMLAEIESGVRPMFASPADFIAALPVITWPST